MARTSFLDSVCEGRTTRVGQTKWRGWHVTCRQSRGHQKKAYPMPVEANPKCVAATMEMRDGPPDAPCQGTALWRSRTPCESPTHIGRAGEVVHSSYPRRLRESPQGDVRP